MKYFLDTYALIEIAQGNPDYEEYSKTESVTLRDNVAEVYYFFLKKLDNIAASFYFDKFSRIIADFPIQLIPHAMNFRKEHRALQKFSFIDCFGYTFALNQKIPFITGDRSFEGFKNVKIVR